ncbi:Protein TusB [Vibrio aerogenes CECT 7868]|uniref:Protein TusB n=1 Tax=Vibrio aerogenes CECT 7868 TaxID=1216006 RepID=A0A1M6EAE3_9VIBR|nr:sulfurtransferase complex subunit TusB [Vibrio aerogenes]SHI82320.1 Protein TusB [Vibrio aerogenes CECT 7868]
MLHIIQSQQAIKKALFYIVSSDTILLIEDGVYCASQNHEFYQMVSGKNVFALAEDIDARGLRPYTGNDICCIDYSGFVDLTAKNIASMTWV